MTYVRRIPLVDLTAQYRSIRSEIDAAIHQIIESSAFVGGEAVSRFETAFAEYCGMPHVVGVGNGTDALELVLTALGIGKGDDVLVPTMTFAATAEAVVAVGARPVFVDCDARTLNMSVAAAHAALTSSTRALIPVHLYGHPAAMGELLDLARGRGLHIVEDAAQAHGARWEGRPVGSFGVAATFSFYPGKNLGAYGDGGAVATTNEDLACRVRLLANHGRTDKYVHEVSGRNSRLDGIQAAVLEAKLRHLSNWTERRRAIAEQYRAGLEGVVGLVEQDQRAYAVFHLFVIMVERRDSVREALRREGISTGVHYPISLHRQPAFARYAAGLQGAQWDSDRLAAKVLSLPMYPELADADVRRIIGVVREAVCA